ncbi:PLP-dependent aminotransferase family protein [Paenibacillus mucilaginosus]|uniref:Transcriptional regulator, GntR family with aminotransferase domain n=1 Tax=Paenibacillus mucilaginosus (strain KNP414) TaxID=1036673 RepID=F8FBX3_PAEMK|nr:PLP-dependent aminotransferase family protein [Paenibacillus mucilaginosus]AEI43734.1 transcriptional regulator, GntR family with aminotransferase domain [Paenibacillus mucilaginosus KNP414]MCG7212741.1 PLP-dependent aminotransferase family protein [Paenibacillus mucilaginosus]WDM25245.1 PLP-dependent aminotransferase family protein [Paenibacillus mucilaginosus]
MFDLSLTNQEELPLYRQLYEQLREGIRDGRIADGSRLPSLRSLRAQLNISKVTVETAYGMLVAEGYAVSRPRSGLYAVRPKGIPPRSSAADPAAPAVAPAPPAAALQEHRIDFRPSAVDPHSFPLRIWRRMLHQASETAAGQLGRYGDPQGEEGLRRVLADYLRTSRGVVCLPEQIVIGSGIGYSMGILARLFTAKSPIAVEAPGYAPVREQWRHCGYEVIPLPAGRQGWALDELGNTGAQVAYLTPSHHFPTGMVMPYAAREQLLSWAHSRDAYIIEDDYDGEFRYEGRPLPSLQSLDRDGRVIYIGTFSKVFSPALRMNYMVLPIRLASLLRSRPDLLHAPSRMEQWAMHAFIAEGHWYRHIRRMRRAYRRKHETLVRGIRSRWDGRIEVTGHSAGLHLEITVHTPHPAGSLTALAAEQGADVYDLRESWLEPAPDGPPRLYLGFGGLTEAEIDQGLTRLERAWEGLWA